MIILDFHRYLDLGLPQLSYTPFPRLVIQLTSSKIVTSCQKRWCPKLWDRSWSLLILLYDDLISRIFKPPSLPSVIHFIFKVLSTTSTILFVSLMSLFTRTIRLSDTFCTFWLVDLCKVVSWTSCMMNGFPTRYKNIRLMVVVPLQMTTDHHPIRQCFDPKFIVIPNIVLKCLKRRGPVVIFTNYGPKVGL